MFCGLFYGQNAWPALIAKIALLSGGAVNLRIRFWLALCYFWPDL